MGNSNSSRTDNLIEEQRLTAEAQRKFDFRIRNYNYAYHGSYIDYVHWCRAQYELECIPECCRQGHNFRPNN
jgi:hypothetical protein